MKNLVFMLGFDANGAMSLVQQYTTPLLNFMLWAVPVAAVLIGVAQGISWFIADEDKKEQKPLPRTLKKTVMYAVIIECIPVIAKLFGIA